MEISPMPPISEDCSSQGESEAGDEGDSNFEQLMVSMLEERDKLQENLRDTQDLLQNTIGRLRDVEKEKNILQAQLEKTMPLDILALTKEANQMRELLQEREEEINELKAERNNTRLLLEHLESLVSRHEKSLRMTVVKRQTQLSANSGVSSEAEVLKALKSLFEHHKALDERYRERYRLAIERANNLEEELEKTRNELKAAKDSCQLSQIMLQHATTPVASTAAPSVVDEAAVPEPLQKEPVASTGAAAAAAAATTTSASSDNVSRLAELQHTIERLNKEMTELRTRAAECQIKAKDWEDKYHGSEERYLAASKELLSSGEAARRYQRDLKEAIAQKEDQEQRISTLEQRYVNLQRECSSLTDLNSRLETELAIRENSLKHAEERFKNLQNKLETSEQKYEQLLKKTQFAGSNSVEEYSKNALYEKHNSIEEKILNLQNELEDAKMELNRAKQREKMTEDHNVRLTQTVDKLLSESNERLQMHLKERMHSLDEKTALSEECERMRRQLEEAEAERERLAGEVSALRAEIEAVRRDNFHLQQSVKNHLSKSAVADTRPPLAPKPTLTTPQSVVFSSSDAEDLKIERALLENDPSSLLNAEPTPSPLASVKSRARQFNLPGKLAPMLFADADSVNLVDLSAGLLDAAAAAASSVGAGFKTTIESKFQQIKLQPTEPADSCDWDKLEEASKVIANVQHAFEMSDAEYGASAAAAAAAGDESTEPMPDSNPYSFNSLSRQFAAVNRTKSPSFAFATAAANAGAGLYSSNGYKTQPTSAATVVAAAAAQSDAQTIAIMIQRQLEDIDNEIRLIKEEKQNTEMRAEELENRVNIIDLKEDKLRSMSPQNGASSPKHHHHHPHAHHFGKTATAAGLFATEAFEPGYNADFFFSKNHHNKNHSLHGSGNMLNQDAAAHSPTSSKNSSNDSLNYIVNKNEQLIEKNFNTLTSNASLPFSDSFGNLAYSNGKKKSLKNTFYRIFMQRKKIQKYSTLQKFNQNNHLVYNSDPQAAPNQPTIKIESDKKLKKMNELLEETVEKGVPFHAWNGPTIVAWLELWVGMPAWYVEACRANVKSGSIMSALSDAEIQREIGIGNSLHRLKLRLAIQEMVNLTSPSAPKSSSAMCLAFGEMNHEWIGNVWLPQIGLPQYRSHFMECLIDARMLEHLTKKDLRAQLKMVDSFHRTSLHYGICVLKRVNYDKNELTRRQQESENENKDILVWSNERVIKWVRSIGLKDYSNNLIESGVHGGVLALDENYNWMSLALALEIPIHDTLSRQVIESEYKMLMASGGKHLN